MAVPVPEHFIAQAKNIIEQGLDIEFLCLNPSKGELVLLDDDNGANCIRVKGTSFTCPFGAYQVAKERLNA